MMSEPSELEGVAKYFFMWQSLSDACPKCRNLNGREWTDQNIYQEVLFDVIWGNLWNLDADHSLAHGVKQYNCRCQLSVRVECNWSKSEWFQELNQTIYDGGRSLSSNIPETRNELQGLRTDIKSTARETTAYRRTFYLTTSELEKATGTRNFAEGMTIMRRWIVLANQARLALQALQFARVMAGDPTALLMAGVTVAETALTVYDLTGC